MPKRSDARRAVLQMLHLVDQNPDADIHRIEEDMREQLKNDVLFEYAWVLFRGVRSRIDEIDKQIIDVAANWRIERMAATDRNVLRMGIYEMQEMDTPTPVVLNECIELAKEFGTEHSSSFVNGILDRLAAK